MIREYSKYKPFRFWCQKVLPLVYDDSLSYYELLNKVVDYLNNVIKDVTALGTAFEELNTMVTDYFKNLDVQEEINNKLDSMVEDGTLDAMILPLVGDAVSEWLEDNVTPTGSAVMVDASLTISGAAADAKVTGNKISDLKSDLLELQNGGYVADAQRIGEVIDDWLDDHPEATTTVQDGAITEVKFANSLKLKSIKDYITPEMYGAEGDGVTDDTVAIQSAVNACIATSKPLALISDYLITNEIVASTAIDIICYGKVICGNASACIAIGSSSTVSQFKDISLNIEGASTSLLGGSVGAKFINLSGCKIDITTNYFERGIILIGDAQGFQNNIVFVKYVYNSDIGITLRPINNGWVNSNTFICGKIGASSAFEGTNRIGIYLNDSGGHAVNNNYFLNPNLESLNTAIRMGRAVSNVFENVRVENVTTILEKDDESAYGNRITIGFGASEDSLEIHGNFSEMLSSFLHKINIDLCGGAANATWFSCAKITSVSNGLLFPFTDGVTYGSKKISLARTKVIGARLNVNSEFLCVGCDASEYSIAIVPYAGDEPIYESLKCVINDGSFGYYEETTERTINKLLCETTSVSSGEKIIFLPSNCDNVLILIRNANNDVDLSSLSFSSIQPISVITLGNANNPVLLGAPTSASPVGSFVMSSAPTASQIGWVMSENGWISV